MAYVLPIASSITLQRKNSSGKWGSSTTVNGTANNDTPIHDAYDYVYTGVSPAVTITLYGVRIMAVSQSGGYCMYTYGGEAVYLLFFGYNNSKVLYSTTISVMHPGARDTVEIPSSVDPYYKYTVNSGSRTYKVVVNNNSSETMTVRRGSYTYNISAGGTKTITATLKTNNPEDRYIYLSKPSYTQPPLLVGTAADKYDQTAIFGPYETENKNANNYLNFYVSDNFPSLGGSDQLHGASGTMLYGSSGVPIWGGANPKATPSLPVNIEWTWGFEEEDPGATAYVNGVVVCDNPHSQSHIISYDLYSLGSSFWRSEDGKTYRVTCTVGIQPKNILLQYSPNIRLYFTFDGQNKTLKKAASWDNNSVTFQITIDYEENTAVIS